MDRFRKEAALSALSAGASGVKALGKGAWGATRVFGKSTGARLGGAAGTTYVASKVPGAVATSKRNKDEAMTPWQGRRVQL